MFARIDHAAGAAQVGLPLRPTELLIFGSSKAGTPLMQTNQAIGIDLPLKALVFEYAAGKVWLTYNDPRWLAKRHGLDAAATQAARVSKTDFKAADADHDGTLTKDEYFTIVEKLFNGADVDKDGALSAKEFQS